MELSSKCGVLHCPSIIWEKLFSEVHYAQKHCRRHYCCGSKVRQKSMIHTCLFFCIQLPLTGLKHFDPSNYDFVSNWAMPNQAQRGNIVFCKAIIRQRNGSLSFQPCLTQSWWTMVFRRIVKACKGFVQTYIGMGSLHYPSYYTIPIRIIITFHSSHIVAPFLVGG